MKDLVRRHPGDYSSAFRLGSAADVRALNVDVSVISTATDVVLGHGDPLRSAVDRNFQTGRDPELPGRICLYNAALHHILHVPVHSVVILLRPTADAAHLTGRHTDTGQPRRGKMDFRYEVFRIWPLPARRLLRCGPGVLPPSVLGAWPPGVSVEDGVTEVVDLSCHRIQRTMSQEEIKHIVTSALVLSGLRLSREQARNAFRRAPAVEESTTYQDIIEQGEIQGVRRVLLRRGAAKFGAPPKEVKAAIQELEDLPRLERRVDCLLDTATSWNDVLETR
ncbi:MAG TPA: hypothetical protein VFF52_18100 [Isosphaeraceae bacterium]|nr:hypothetical protein [Isosphaeraceae bacterium]